jgi:hypothetical protein
VSAGIQDSGILPVVRKPGPQFNIISIEKIVQLENWQLMTWLGGQECQDFNEYSL